VGFQRNAPGNWISFSVLPGIESSICLGLAELSRDYVGELRQKLVVGPVGAGETVRRSSLA
jgi:hypothetical protein